MSSTAAPTSVTQIFPTATSSGGPNSNNNNNNIGAQNPTTYYFVVRPSFSGLDLP
jgi:hypothetical protein